MKLPLGLQDSTPNKVCKLQRSLYGLKEARHQWYAKLSTFLLSLNYTCSSVDNSLFLKYIDHHVIVILVYVDDIVLIGNIVDEHLTSLLHSQFCIRNLEDLIYFL